MPYNSTRKESPQKYSLISPFDYARINGVHINTVYAWIKKGYLHPHWYYTDPGKAGKQLRRFKLWAHEPCPHPLTGRNAGAWNAVHCQSLFDPDNPEAQITMDDYISLAKEK